MRLMVARHIKTRASYCEGRHTVPGDISHIMGRRKKHEKPVQVRIAYSDGFLGYMNKAIKLPDLLRTNRKRLPELLLVLDRTEPMDLMVSSRLRLSAQFGRFAL